MCGVIVDIRGDTSEAKSEAAAATAAEAGPTNLIDERIFTQVRTYE